VNMESTVKKGKWEKKWNRRPENSDRGAQDLEDHRSGTEKEKKKEGAREVLTGLLTCHFNRRKTRRRRKTRGKKPKEWLKGVLL